MLSLTALAAPLAAPLYWHGPGPGGFGLFFLLIPLFWIAVIVLVITFAGRRWRRASMQRWSGSGSAERTLAERFAQGDIEEVEYRARLEVLRANRLQP